MADADAGLATRAPATVTSSRTLQPNAFKRQRIADPTEVIARLEEMLDMESPGVELALNYHVRSRTVRFIGEMVKCFDMRITTWWLAVSYFDHYIHSSTSQPRLDIDIAAAACFIIACKFDDIKRPSYESFSSFWSLSPSRETLIVAERTVLNAIGWRLHRVAPHAVAEALAEVLAVDAQAQSRATEMLGASQFVEPGYLPSVVAAACFDSAYDNVLARLVKTPQFLISLARDELMAIKYGSSCSGTSPTSSRGTPMSTEL